MELIGCFHENKISSSGLETKIEERFEPVNYCEQVSYYKVDIKAKALIDSLAKLQVDSILYYRSISTLTRAPISSLSGEGYLFWKQNDLVKKVGLSYIYDTVDVIYYASAEKEKLFDFYWDNKIDTIFSHPRITGAKYPNSIGSEYFIYSERNGNLACYYTTSYGLRKCCINLTDTAHLRYQHIEMFTGGAF